MTVYTTNLSYLSLSLLISSRSLSTSYSAACLLSIWLYTLLTYRISPWVCWSHPGVWVLHTQLPVCCPEARDQFWICEYYFSLADFQVLQFVGEGQGWNNKKIPQYIYPSFINDSKYNVKTINCAFTESSGPIAVFFIIFKNVKTKLSLRIHISMLMRTKLQSQWLSKLEYKPILECMQMKMCYQWLDSVCAILRYKGHLLALGVGESFTRTATLLSI